MLKTYNTPELTLKGTAVELTLGIVRGALDGDETDPFPFGTLGFSL